MSIPIRVFTVIIKVQSLDSLYPGGSGAYINGHPGAAHDGSLVGVGAMSGCGVQLIIDNLAVFGLRLGLDVAVGDMVHGAFDSALGIAFHGRPFDWYAALDAQ